MKKYLSLLTTLTIPIGTGLTMSSIMNSNINNTNLLLSEKLNEATVTPKLLPGTVGRVLTMKTAPNGTIWVGTTVGLFKSLDNKQFTQVKLNINHLYEVTTLVISNDGSIYVGVKINAGIIKTGGLYKSTDGINFVPNPEIIGPIDVLSISPKDDSIWIGFQTLTNNLKLFKSTDNGNHFQEVSLFNKSQVGKISALTIGQDGTIWLYSYTHFVISELYKSTDGETFTRLSNTSPGNKVTSLAVEKNGTLLIGSNFGLYKTIDGVKFSKIDGETGIILSIALTLNQKIVVGTTDGLYTSLDNSTFTKVDGVNSKVESLMINEEGTEYIGTDTGVYKLISN